MVHSLDPWDVPSQCKHCKKRKANSCHNEVADLLISNTQEALRGGSFKLVVSSFIWTFSIKYNLELAQLFNHVVPGRRINRN